MSNTPDGFKLQQEIFSKQNTVIINRNYMSLGKYVTTIHNPESVVEIYLDKKQEIVTEIKNLNCNRSKQYSYSLKDYLQMVRGFKGVDISIKNALKS